MINISTVARSRFASLQPIALFILSIFFACAWKAVSDNPFLIDDVGMIHRGVEMVHHPSTLFQLDHAGRIHPAASLLWGGIHQVFQLRPQPYYTVWLFFHAANVFLLFGLARRLGVRPGGAWVSALCFACASVHHQLVAWIGDGIRVMMVSFFLTAIHFHLQYLKTQLRRWEVGAFCAWLIALACMEDAIILPLVLFVVDLFFEKKIKARAWPYGRWICWFSFAAVLAGIAFLFLNDAVGRYTQHPLELLPKMAGVVWTLVHLVIPRSEILDTLGLKGEIFRAAVPTFFLGGFVFWGLIISKRIFQESRALFVLALVWFVTALAPFMLRDLVEWKTFPPPRYFYLPLAGMALWLGLAAQIVWARYAYHARLAVRLTFRFTAGAAFLYVLVLNGVTYVYMADKLARDWRVHQPPRDFLLNDPTAEALKHYSFDLIPA